MQAKFVFQYPSAKFAQSVMKALMPDNLAAGKGMRITSKTRGRVLIVVIDGCKRVETLQATVQDVFRCIGAAEASIAQAAKSEASA